MLAEYEKHLIGGIIADPGLMSEIFLTEKDFQSIEARKVWITVENLISAGAPVNLLTVGSSLKDEPAARTFAAECTGETNSGARVRYYAEKVFSASKRRELQNLCKRVLIALEKDKVETVDLLDELDKGLTSLVSKGSESMVLSYDKVMKNALVDIKAAHESKGRLRGFSTGFPDLDKKSQGFQPGELWVIGARPSEGKTVLGMSMASALALDAGVPTAFFSIEMPATSLGIRNIASRNRINALGLTSGYLNETDYGKLANICVDGPLFIVDSPSISMAQLSGNTRRLVRSNGVKVIFIDYLTLIRFSGNLQRHEAVAECSRSLKSLARELKITIVVLAQIKRESVGREPFISDLRESSQIEQDADTILLIHNSDEEDGVTDSKLIIGKNRNGPKGSVQLKFTKKFLKFEEYVVEE